ncbi:MAG: phosphate ABC transporter ATP-binding protein [Anaerolineales bacterium]
MNKITIDHFSLAYSDGTQALREISLEIPENQIFVVFGPAGGGKSSLLRSLNRLNDLADVVKMEGTVQLDGEDIFQPSYDVIQLRRKVGMVFARPVVLPLTIRGNLTYGLTVAGISDQARLDRAVETSLQKAALWEEVRDRLDDPAVALSGGQQQRLCLARVLALEPEVILLDEPTSGLDPISTGKVEESLQELKKEYTIVLVPHSVQQAARTADIAAFLLQGDLIETNRGEVLFNKPVDQRTQDYIQGRFG